MSGHLGMLIRTDFLLAMLAYPALFGGYVTHPVLFASIDHQERNTVLDCLLILGKRMFF
jgi:hypothetical protein